MEKVGSKVYFAPLLDKLDKIIILYFSPQVVA
jgi:hypothetical protein